MGVRDFHNYPEIKRMLGIPDDEPIMIIRAQDQASTLAIASYTGHAKSAGCSKEFLQDLADLNMAFSSWRVKNPGKVKVPD